MPKKRKDSSRGLPTGLYRKKGSEPPYWSIRRTVNGRTISVALGTMPRAEAIAQYHEVMAEAGRGSPSGALLAKRSRAWTPTLQDFFEEQYLPYRSELVGRKTLEGDRTHCGWLVEYFGEDKPIGEITTAEAQQYIPWRRRHGGFRGKSKRRLVKSRTIAIDMNTLRRALDFAHDLGLIQTVPKIKVPSQRGEKPPPRWHTREQMEKVIAAALHPRHRLLFLTAYLTGMRRGELLTREWSDVAFDRGEHGIIRVTHKPLIGFRVKMGRERVIPLCPRLRQALLEVPEEDRHGYIFVYGGCRQLSYTNALRRACIRAKVPVITQHSTRKTFASLAAMDGMEISTLMAIGGWSTAQVLLEIYAQVDTEHTRRAMGSLSFGQEVKEPIPEWEGPLDPDAPIPELPSSPTFTSTCFPPGSISPTLH